MPPPYHECNNSSALSNMDFVRSEVAKLLRKNAISVSKTIPHCCNPLSVTFKKSNNAKRLVIDLSRHVNNFIQPTPIKLDDLSYLSPWFTRDSYLMTFDLSSMYHHLQITPDHRKYLGFAVPQPSGVTEYYVFNVLPFGLNEAVSIMSRVCQPLKTLIRTYGFRFGLYIDDGILISSCKNHISSVFNLILLVFQSAGWSINWEKTSDSPSLSIQYLGLIIDTRAEKFFAPDSKIRNITDHITCLRTNMSISAKNLANILGQIAFLYRACGNICKILTRSSQHSLGHYVNLNGWDSMIPVTTEMKNELMLFLSYLPLANGQPIQDRPCIFVANNQPNYADYDYHFVSDASSEYSYFYDHYNQEFALLLEFPDGLKEASSGARELNAICLFLDTSAFSKLANRKIIWETDSQNVFYWLKHGSRLPHIQTQILNIKKLEFQHNFTITCNWLPRSHPSIMFADDGSKLALSSDEWSIDHASYDRLLNFFQCQPNIDVFASVFNSKCQRFISKLPMQHSSGTNFFVQKFSISDILWCCPPVSCAGKAFNHIVQNNLPETIFVVPVWKKSNFWQLISNGIYFHPRIHQFSLFNPKFSCRVETIFTKPHKFSMIALKIRNFSRHTSLLVPTTI